MTKNENLTREEIIKKLIQKEKATGMVSDDFEIYANYYIDDINDGKISEEEAKDHYVFYSFDEFGIYSYPGPNRDSATSICVEPDSYEVFGSEKLAYLLSL